MATVYRARDSELRRDVAVKVLFPHLCKRREVVARFQREARAVAALDHRNILRVHDVGGGAADDTSGRELDPPFIVLELVPGGSLREHMEGRGPVVAEVVARIGADMCSALAVAHRAGIVHRDIKPANIMIADGGRMVLADFGVARVEDEDSSLVTRTGAILGTPAYMSPEQAQGDPTDARSDLYSLGATLYQLATGSMPFSGPTPKVMYAIAHGELAPPLRRTPAMGRELAQVIERLMAPDPDARYASADDAGAALAAIADEAGVDDGALADYVADPDGFTAALVPRVVARSLERAERAAADGEIPQALALADRVLALDADNADALALVGRLGNRSRRARLMLAVAGVAVLAGGVGGYLALAPGAGPSPAVLPAGLLDAGADDGGSPDARGARDRWDAAVLANDPVGVTDAGSRPVVRHTGPTVRRKPVDAGLPDARPTAAVRPADARPPPRPARVTLDIRPWCNVSIDGTGHGRVDPQKTIELAAGKHTLVCSQGRGMGEWRQTVTLKPGESRNFRGSVLNPVAVRVEVRGDGVRIGGRFHATGSKLELAPDRYRIEVVTRGKVTGSRWVTIPRVTACSLRDRPAIDCYKP